MKSSEKSVWDVFVILFIGAALATIAAGMNMWRNGTTVKSSVPATQQELLVPRGVS
jgi:hypothetical protein